MTRDEAAEVIIDALARKRDSVQGYTGRAMRQREQLNLATDLVKVSTPVNTYITGTGLGDLLGETDPLVLEALDVWEEET